MTKIEEDSVLDGNSLIVEFCIFCLALRVSFHIVFFRHYWQVKLWTYLYFLLKNFVVTFLFGQIAFPFYDYFAECEIGVM